MEEVIVMILSLLDRVMYEVELLIKNNVFLLSQCCLS